MTTTERDPYHAPPRGRHLNWEPQRKYKSTGWSSGGSIPDKWTSRYNQHLLERGIKISNRIGEKNQKAVGLEPRKHGRDCAWGGQVYTRCIIPTEPAALPLSADAHGWALSGQVKDGISTVLGSLAAGWGVHWGVVCNGVGESKCRWLSRWQRKELRPGGSAKDWER